MLIKEKMSDQQVILLLLENNLLAWDSLYDKYSSAMYGIILNLTDDKTLAEEIFIPAFIQLKENQILANVKYALCPTLLIYTFNYTTKYLNQSGLNPKIFSPAEEVELIHLLCNQCNSIKKVASILNMTEEATKKKLRSEMLNLRNQKNLVKSSKRDSILKNYNLNKRLHQNELT